MKYVALIITGVALTYILIVHQGLNSFKGSQEYEKLFMEKGHSLILGTSRAAKLNDSLISINFKKTNLEPILNYAFNLNMSPYGPLYSESIIRHIDFSSERKGVFIVCVDPWAFSEKKFALNDSSIFRENRTSIDFNADQKWATYKYFLHNYSKSYFHLFTDRNTEKSSASEARPSPQFVQNHLEAKLASYRLLHFNSEDLSPLRLQSFRSLIQKLLEKGDVYLVKLPVSNEMVALENEYAPEFDKIINTIANEFNLYLIDFYDYSDRFLCYDGNHLWQPDADKVSAIISDIINLVAEDILDIDKAQLMKEYVQSSHSKYKHYLMSDKKINF